MTPDQIQAALARLIAEQRAQLEIFASEIARLREENAALRQESTDEVPAETTALRPQRSAI